MRVTALLRNILRQERAPEPTGEAFALVRQLLRDRPRHFREILADGVAGSAQEGEEKPVAFKMKKIKGKAKAEVEPISVPKGHPFVSST